MVKKVRIGIIDSGIDLNHEKLKEYDFKKINIESNNESEYSINENVSDNIGHGTAIAYQIKSEIPESEIYIIKLFDTEKETTAEDMIFALEYIYKNIELDIIHISNGVTETTQKYKLEEICNKLRQKGVILVSAFDNYGSISYPAAFNCVIGVDWNIDCIKKDEYIFVKNSKVNILAIGKEQRLPWINNSYKNVSGSSFAAPYITGKIANLISQEHIDYKNILSELEKRASKILNISSEKKVDKMGKINKAIILPFNKEIHSIIRFENNLNFKIEGIYDYRLSGNIGHKTIDNKNIFIKDLKKINWEDDFDTVILGHTKTLSKLAKEDLLLYVLNKCKIYKKNLYAFDGLKEYSKLKNEIEETNWVYFPHVDKENVVNNNLNKLYEIPIPVVGVFGTSSKQGKFTLQMKLRNELIKKGYKIGQIGTEPSSLLYNIDYCYPIGYDSTVNISGKESIIYINKLMSNLDNNDLIIVGSQSQTIPYMSGNLGFYPLAQHELLLASNPDVVILCVNANDELDYIDRTIKYIESLANCEVLALVIFPFIIDRKWSIVGNNFNEIDFEQLICIKNNLNKKFNKPVYVLNDTKDIANLSENIIEYFS